MRWGYSMRAEIIRLHPNLNTNGGCLHLLINNLITFMTNLLITDSYL